VVAFGLREGGLGQADPAAGGGPNAGALCRVEPCGSPMSRDAAPLHLSPASTAQRRELDAAPLQSSVDAIGGRESDEEQHDERCRRRCRGTPVAERNHQLAP